MLAETNRLYGLAMTNPHVEIARLGEAISAAERARAALAGQMNSSEGRLAQALLAKLGQEHHDAVRDREMLARLAGIRATSSDDVLELSAIDTEYTHAFAEYGVNVDEIPVVESAAKLRAWPVATTLELAAALDDWASVRRRVTHRPEDWKRCLRSPSLPTRMSSAISCEQRWEPRIIERNETH